MPIAYTVLQTKKKKPAMMIDVNYILIEFMVTTKTNEKTLKLIMNECKICCTNKTIKSV